MTLTNCLGLSWTVVLCGGMFVLGGCASGTASKGGMVTWITAKQKERFARALGQKDVYSYDLSRSAAGDVLFVQFQSSPSVHWVGSVSSSGVVLKGVPGLCRFDDSGEPVFWYNDRLKKLEFASGYITPTNVFTWHMVSDGRFLALFDTNHCWVAPVGAPFKQIVGFGWDREVLRIFSSGDRLHIFVRGQPEGKPRPDRWSILKRYEYDVSEDPAHLVRIQDFEFTRVILDFDPRSGLLLVRSLADKLPGAWLVDTANGSRSDLGPARGDGFFLEGGASECFRRAVAGSGVESTTARGTTTR
jgi:hypothetical protein